MANRFQSEITTTSFNSHRLEERLDKRIYDLVIHDSTNGDNNCATQWHKNHGEKERERKTSAAVKISRPRRIT